MKRVLACVTCGLVAAIALCAPRDASAVELGTPASKTPFRSAQHFALEFRFSPYYPQVDDDPALNGAKPFASNFGTNAKFFIGAELDWQTLRIPHLGTIGPGLGLGYVSMSRTVSTATGRASADETSLTIYPFWLVAVLRADVFWRDMGFPIVPYAKVGVAAARWKAQDGGGTSKEGGKVGRGTSLGTNIAIGASLALDALDPGASRNMDNATGINNTYLFIEAYWLTLDTGLGDREALRVGTNTWSMGLAFEF